MLSRTASYTTPHFTERDVECVAERPSLPGCVLSLGLLGHCATLLTTTTTTSAPTPATHTSALTIITTTTILGRQHTTMFPAHYTTNTVTPLVTTTSTPQATTVPCTPALNAAQKNTSFPVLGSHVPQRGSPGVPAAASP